jgi:hypothetical protein
MAVPVVIVTSNGRPVVNVASNAPPMTVVDTNGEAIILVDAGAEPVTLLNPDGTLWVSQGFDQLIASLLSAGETVAFYDPNDLTSVYAARTGGANAVADGPVGLMLDKAQMGGLTAAEYLAALDTPELVTNGTFDTDSNWNKGTGWTISGGVASVSGTASRQYLQQNITGITLGKIYQLKFEVVSITSGSVKIFQGSGAYSLPSASTTGTFTRTYASASTSNIFFYGDPGDDFSIDNISVKEIPGYHATAPSDAARPILRDVSSTYALDFDNVDDVHNIALPNDSYDTWTVASDGSVTFGTTTLSGGTGYALNTDNAGFGITTATLTAAQKSIIEASY